MKTFKKVLLTIFFYPAFLVSSILIAIFIESIEMTDEIIWQDHEER